MKKELFEALKAKFTGVSDNILNRIAERMSKTVTTTEQVKAAVNAYTLQQVIDSYADSRATEAQQTAVHNYESKYGLKDGAKVEKLENPLAGGADSQTNALLQKLLEQNNALNERLNKMDADRTTSTRKQQLNDVIGKLPEALRKGYERTPVVGLTDEQFSALLGEVTTEVDGIVQAKNERGALFGRPTAGSGNPKQDEELSKEQMAAIQHRETIATGDMQPF